MESVFTVLSFFLLASITLFALNSASAYSQPQDSCCGSSVESVIVATASGCTCDDMENLAFINVTTKMMKLHSISGVSLLSHVDAPESYGLENLIANSAEESPSSESHVHAQNPNYGPNSTPASAEVPAEYSSDAWIIGTVLFMLLLVSAYMFYQIFFVELKRLKEVEKK